MAAFAAGHLSAPARVAQAGSIRELGEYILVVLTVDADCNAARFKEADGFERYIADLKTEAADDVVAGVRRVNHIDGPVHLIFHFEGWLPDALGPLREAMLRYRSHTNLSRVVERVNYSMRPFRKVPLRTNIEMLLSPAASQVAPRSFQF